MNTRITFLLLLIGASFNVLGQQTKPYWYDNTITLIGNPSSAKEYYYDYNTQVEKLVRNHSFKYDVNGRLLEHIETNKDISDLYQTFRHRFQYDSKGRLVYFWREQETMNGYESEREEQWIYDSYDMLTEYNNWSVYSGTKYIGSPSMKRIITREGSGKVTRVEYKDYSTVSEDFELNSYRDYMYKTSGGLDSIIIYEKNITLGGIMLLKEKKYNFNEKVKDYKNVDLLKFNSYVLRDTDDNIITTAILYDAEGRLLSEMLGTTSDVYTYEEDRVIHIENHYKKTITYLDGFGLETKTEFYYYNEDTETWDLDWMASQIITREYDSDKITSQLLEVLNGEEYKKETRYDFAYSVTSVLKRTELAFISVYPNPTSAGFRLSEGNSWSGSTLEMTDIIGHKVYGAKIENEGEEIVPKNLIPGLYFLKVIKGEIEYRSKVQVY